MTDEIPSLDELRRQIDQIDVAVHDLLMQRMSLADQIGRAKGKGTPVIRPGREAVILRTLVARHRGPFPKAVVVRIWREIISAMTALEGPFAVAVYAPPGSGEGLRALARAHYGSERPISAHETVAGVLRAVGDGQATVGVLPLPRGDEPGAWWQGLTREGVDAPRIIARLPFTAQSRRFDGQEALAIALVPPEASGQDRGYLVIENTGQMSRSALRTALTHADLAAVDIQNGLASDGNPLVLVEVEGFMAPDDPRLARLAADQGGLIRQTWVIGGYAVPLSAEELTSEDDASGDGGWR